jgi:hypothetical protein
VKNSQQPNQNNTEPPKDYPVPKTLKQARDGPYWGGFQDAITQEFESLEKNDTWTYANLKSIPRKTNIL